MEFKRNSDVRTIILGLATESDPESSFISAIGKNVENFLTSDFYDATILYSFNADGSDITNSKNHYWGRPSTHRWQITHPTFEKIVGLQFADIKSSSIPNESNIAFGSEYYSNDEQKAFALKYDCTIAKSPAKTQYYFLNEEEEKVITHFQKERSIKLSIHSTSYNRLYIAPVVARDQINSYFDSNAFRTHLHQKLIQDRVWFKLCPQSNGTALLANGTTTPQSLINFSVLDAIAYGYKYMFLRHNIYKDAKHLTKASNSRHSMTSVPDLKYVNLECGNYYKRPVSSYNGKNYEKPCIFEVFLTDDQVASYKNGEDITVNIPLSSATNDWHFTYERSQAGYSYNQTNYIKPADYLSTLFIPITINNKTQNTKLVSELTYTGESEIDCSVVDRLVGFLSENSDIKLVSSTAFANQLREDSPRLTTGTYDSLFGMICSDDANTRKTAIKMLQGFDIPMPTEPNALAGYIKDLAVDLAVNSGTTGASVNKWLVKYTGYNINNQPRTFYRRAERAYTNNPYEISSNSNVKYKSSPFNFDQKYHPAMTYDERSAINDKVSTLESNFVEYFASSYKDMRKYFPHSSMNNPYFSSIATYVINKYDSEKALANPDKVTLEQCELYIRHYVNYLIDKVFLGMNNKIPYTFEFNSPADIAAFNPNSSYIAKNFGEYKTLIDQAKASAIKNPVLFMNLIKEASSKYELKFGLNSNSWNRDREFEFIIQSMSMGDNIISYNKMTNQNHKDPSSFGYTNVLESLRLVVQLGTTQSKETTLLV